MVSALANAFGLLDRMGVFDVVLPFVLTFAIVYAILDRSRVLGVVKIKGKAYPKSQLNATVAFVLGFLVIASASVVGVLRRLAEWGAVLTLFVAIGITFFSFFGAKLEKPKGNLWAIVLIALLLALGAAYALGFWDRISLGFVESWILPALLFLAVTVAIISWIVREDEVGAPAKKPAKEKKTKEEREKERKERGEEAEERRPGARLERERVFTRPELEEPGFEWRPGRPG